MKKSLKNKVAKVVLGFTLAGALGIGIGDVLSHQVLKEDTTVHAASYRTWEYRTIRSGVGYIRQRRSVIKGYYKNVGWVYSSVGPWQTY